MGKKFVYDVKTLELPEDPERDLVLVTIELDPLYWFVLENSHQWKALEELYSDLKTLRNRYLPQEPEEPEVTLRF